jgi:hypothetical protein
MWPSVQAQTVHYEGGLSVSSGDYIFTERTTSWTLTNGLALAAGPFTFRATVPLYRQNTTLITGTGTGPVPTGGSSSGIVADSAAARSGKRQGGMGQDVAAPSVLLAQGPVDVPATAVTGYEFAVGDPLASVSLALIGTSPVSLTIGAGIKLPLTDTTGFGTGEWDYGGSLSLSYRLGYTSSLGLNLGYWHLGDLPDLELNDPLMGSVTFAYLAPSGWGGLVSVSGSTSAISEFAAPAYAGATMTRVAGSGTFGVHASVGLTESAPDFTLGVSWRVDVR